MVIFLTLMAKNLVKVLGTGIVLAMLTLAGFGCGGSFERPSYEEQKQILEEQKEYSERTGSKEAGVVSQIVYKP